MLRFSTWKVVLILAVCAAGLVFSLPNLFSREQMERLPDWIPHQQINLGLDLQGGSHLLLEVDLKTMIKDRLGSLRDEVRNALTRGDRRIGYRGLGVHGDAVTLTLTDPSAMDDAMQALQGLNPNRFSPEFAITDAGGGKIE
ncbi:MAG: hypothetical protein ACREH6_06060, partial [Geminicoccaceae bacterium]